MTQLISKFRQSMQSYQRINLKTCVRIEFFPFLFSLLALMLYLSQLFIAIILFGLFSLLILLL